MSPRQPRTGSNGKTKVVWGLEHPAAFICLELMHRSLERWDKIKKGMKEGRERSNKSMKANINLWCAGSRLPVHGKHSV